MGSKARIAAILGAGMVLAACGGAEGGPAPVPAKPFSPAQSRQLAVEDSLRATDPCGLLDEGLLADAGEVLQYGSAVQPSVCSALIRDADGAETAVDVSLLPSMLSDVSVSNPVEMNGATAYLGGGPDLGRGTCQRVFELDLGEEPERTPAQYATVRSRGPADTDSCPLADAVLESATARMVLGLPVRVDGTDWAVDAVGSNPCEVLTAFPEAARVVDTALPPTPFQCTFHPDGVESSGNVVTLALGVKAVSEPETDESYEPKRVEDGCRSTFPVGREIDVTRPGVEVDEFARALGNARAVVTVHGGDCGIVGKVTDAARSTFE